MRKKRGGAFVPQLPQLGRVEIEEFEGDEAFGEGSGWTGSALDTVRSGT
jgi:hypothetical protein